jgi:NTP pyrophosphatase (non-canonical NTP hydrolase)
MDPSDYQRLASRTKCNQEKAAETFRVHGVVAAQIAHSVIGLSGEVGELSTTVEHWLYYGQALDRGNIKEELGDCLWYIAEACDALGLLLSDVMESNIRKLRKRYPEKYDDELAKEENRDRNAEKNALLESDPTMPPLTDSYARRCSVCKRMPIHRINSSGVCSQCAADLRMSRLEGRYEQTGAGFAELVGGEDA